MVVSGLLSAESPKPGFGGRVKSKSTAKSSSSSTTAHVLFSPPHDILLFYIPLKLLSVSLSPHTYPYTLLCARVLNFYMLVMIIYTICSYTRQKFHCEMHG